MVSSAAEVRVGVRRLGEFGRRGSCRSTSGWRVRPPRCVSDHARLLCFAAAVRVGPHQAAVFRRRGAYRTPSGCCVLLSPFVSPYARVPISTVPSTADHAGLLSPAAVAPVGPRPSSSSDPRRSYPPTGLAFAAPGPCGSDPSARSPAVRACGSNHSPQLPPTPVARLAGLLAASSDRRPVSSPSPPRLFAPRRRVLPPTSEA